MQPRHAAFPEIIEATGGGVIAEPNARALADAVEELLLKPERARALGEAGRKAVRERFNVERMAREVLVAFESAKEIANRQSPTANRQS